MHDIVGHFTQLHLEERILHAYCIFSRNKHMSGLREFVPSTMPPLYLGLLLCELYSKADTLAWMFTLYTGKMLLRDYIRFSMSFYILAEKLSVSQLTLITQLNIVKTELMHK